MAKSRSQYPVLTAFGRLLKAGRGARSRQHIADRLADLGTPLAVTSLLQYEAGSVWSPDPCVLWGLAQLYGLPLDQIIGRLRANRRDPHIVSFDLSLVAQGTALPSVPADAATASGGRQDREHRLKATVARYRRRLTQARASAARTVALLEEDGGDRPAGPRGGRPATQA